MKCQKCLSERVAYICAKCSDNGSCKIDGQENNGYVLGDMGIGGGDYVEFSWCLECGQIQGKFPLPACELEKDISDEVVIDYYDNHFTEGEHISNMHEQELYDASCICHKFGNFVEDFFLTGVQTRCHRAKSF